MSSWDIYKNASKTIKVAPVAIAFAKRAIASFPIDNLSAIIPDPTTVDKRK